ncbi:MAG: STAS/SEC14 domain-containing protein [Maribacter sp.]|nr:STAS/SEC14 domain-containing protein [Maribacter sp.]
MLKLLKDLPDNVLGVSAEGKITGTDYENILIPAVEDKLHRHKKIAMLYQLGDKFTGYDLNALWDDTKLGMKHLSSWEKVALVSDHEMINAFARFFGHMFSCEFRIFKNSEFEQARKWIAEK